MVALTIDALNRYREIFPPIRGSLTKEVQSSPIRDEEEAVKLFQLYLNQVKKEAKNFSQDKCCQAGSHILLHEDSTSMVVSLIIEG